MRFWLLVLGILISCALTQPFLPWWTLVIIAFIWGYGMPLPARYHSFWAGFLAAALLWGAYAFYISWGNDGLLAGRIGRLLGGMPGDVLPLVSGLFAGALSGLGALCGRLGRDLVK